MITNKDLQEAIAECQGVRNPNANTCIKLASYYTIMDHMNTTPEEPVRYSYDPGPVDTFGYFGDTEFLRLIEGKNMDRVMSLFNELVDTIHVISPRLYDGFIRKLKGVE